MNRFDMLMGRDGRRMRNARGQYTSRRDMTGRGYREQYPDYNYGRDREHEYLGPEYPNRDKERMRDGHHMYPFELAGRFGYEEEYDPYREEMMYGRGRDYNRGYDYAGGEMLSDRDLMEWSKRLLGEVEEKDKAFFKYENIEKKAKDMGIKFDKFSLDEFYVVVLMQFTDYYKTLGTANMDIYLRLAKDWLCDEDVAMKYGEKLAAYYDYVVE